MIGLLAVAHAVELPSHDDVLTPTERADVALLRAIAPGPPEGADPSATDVDVWVGLFTGRLREPFSRWLGGLDHRRGELELVLEGEELPTWLGSLALVESGMMPHATSTSGAAGLWQIAVDTAPLLDLRVDPLVDERRDPVLSTAAAARLLGELHARFGDWDLAMAAYNAGPEALDAAIRGAGTRDFDALAAGGFIGAEPRHFVAKIHAARRIGEDRAAFGVVADPPAAAPAEPAMVRGAAPLDRLAGCAGWTTVAFRRANPTLGPLGTPPEGRAVRVPDAPAFRACIEAPGG